MQYQTCNQKLTKGSIIWHISNGISEMQSETHQQDKLSNTYYETRKERIEGIVVTKETHEEELNDSDEDQAAGEQINESQTRVTLHLL